MKKIMAEMGQGLKILLGVMVIFIAVSMVCAAWSSTTFNNSLSIENLTFTSGGNFTRWLSIPNTNFFITSGYLNLSGYNTKLQNNTGWCMQQNANASHVNDSNCVLEFSGNYVNGGGWSLTSPWENTVDGSWDSLIGAPNASGGPALGFVNYTKPGGAQNTSLWITEGRLGGG